VAPLPGFSLARRLAAGEDRLHRLVRPAGAADRRDAGARRLRRRHIDQQHGLWDTAATLTGISAIRQGGAAPLVRIPLGAFDTASACSTSAPSVIAPMIKHRHRRQGLRRRHQIPAARRAQLGPGARHDGRRHRRHEGVSRRRQREHRYARHDRDQTALDNVEAIATTPGIDVLFVGPSDLSIALTNGAELDPHSAKVEAVLDRVIAVANKAGKVAGLYCANAEARRRLRQARHPLHAVASDLAFLRAGAAAQLKTLKG